MQRLICLTLLLVSSAALAARPEPLFNSVGARSSSGLPAHSRAAQAVSINRGALQHPVLQIDLFGETVEAVRMRIERQSAGAFIWVGHLAGNAADSVIVTARGGEFSGLIQRGADMYRISGAPGGAHRLIEVDLPSLPPEDSEGLPDGFGDASASSATAVAGDNVVQDLLVAYTQAACNYAGGCSQLEADIATAVADMNVAFAESGVSLTMNLVGAVFTDYVDPGSLSTALSELRGTSDGKMDELHDIRDQLGADLVALVYNGPGCGIGYLSSSASTAFSVTDVPCLVGNRTLAHELGHNQGAHHDRVTVGGGSSGGYNYGYRRCSDGSADDFGAPYFRTVLAYPCSSAPRVGRYSNPDVNYLGVPQGVDPALDPDSGAWNARTINESAAYVAGFRTAATTSPPVAPGSLGASASAFDTVELAWNDNSDDEAAFIVELSTDSANWSVIASLGADTTSHTENGLQAETTYYFRVKAQNSAGDSGYSNTASATTPAAPDYVDNFATGETAITGLVSGTFDATRFDDSVSQTITETGNGGPRRKRTQSLAHRWIFEVSGGSGGVVFTANAWVSGDEGALFRYSADSGASWQSMFSVDSNAADNVQLFVMPASTSATIWVEARDAAQSPGEPADTLSVDYLVMTSLANVGSPPLAPTTPTLDGVTATSVSFSFVDNATDEVGFEIHRSLADPLGNCGAGAVIDSLGASASVGSVAYADTNAVPDTTYWYWVSAFNGAGASCSGTLEVTTIAGSLIELNADAYKVKGVQTVDLEWSGASASSVDIRRDGVVIATTANDGAYTDTIGSKGGGSYRYELCESGSSSACSNPLTVVF